MKDSGKPSPGPRFPRTDSSHRALSAAASSPPTASPLFSSRPYGSKFPHKPAVRRHRRRPRAPSGALPRPPGHPWGATSGTGTPPPAPPVHRGHCGHLPVLGRSLEQASTFGANVALPYFDAPQPGAARPPLRTGRGVSSGPVGDPELPSSPISFHPLQEPGSVPISQTSKLRLRHT